MPTQAIDTPAAAIAPIPTYNDGAALLAEARTHLDWMVAVRRELHRHPELMYDLHRTSEAVRRELAQQAVGQIVEIVQAPDSHRPPIGRVLTVLGDKLTASLAVEAAIHGHEIPHEFPQAVLDEHAGQGFGAFKPALADTLVAVLSPIRQRMTGLMDDPAELDRLLAAGAARAAARAQPTLDAAYAALGLRG